MLTVLIPVGPNPIYLQYLPEAIESVLNQTVQVDEILIVADGADISLDFIRGIVVKYSHAIEMFDDKFTLCQIDSNKTQQIRLWKSPWNIGFAQAFNCGVGLAYGDLILYLAADDTLAPTCVEDCLNTWNENHQKDAWYALTYKSYPSGNEATIPINAAMITRNLWKWLGGFPPAAFAGPDAAALSILMCHASDRIIKVCEGKFNYFIREHDEQETKKVAWVYSAEMTSIRNKLTANFKPHEEIQLK